MFVRVCKNCGSTVKNTRDRKIERKYCNNCYNSSRDENYFSFDGDKCILTIITKKETIKVSFDSKFYHSLKDLYWSIDYKCGKNYVRTGSRKFSSRLLHRIVCSLEYGEDKIKGKVIDHYDGNIYNNTISNLKIVTQKENNINKKGAQSNNHSTGERGITKIKNGSFSVSINKKYYGLFKDINEAIRVRDEALKKEFGWYLNEC